MYIARYYVFCDDSKVGSTHNEHARCFLMIKHYTEAVAFLFNVRNIHIILKKNIGTNLSMLRGDDRYRYTLYYCSGG